MFNRSTKLSFLLFAMALMPSTFTACDCGTEEPPPGEPAKITRFNVEPLTVMSGQTVTVSWTVENATNVNISTTPSGVFDERSTQLTGSKMSMPILVDTVFVITATGEGAPATQMRTVTVMAGEEVAILEFN